MGSGAIEADVKSEYSHILIRRQGSMRSMNFVRDNGVEQIQTALEHEAAVRPGDAIQPPDVRQLLLHARQKQVLIVGLGGGAMVHFYEHYDPDVKVDVVEIDAKVVQLADKYFDVRTQKNTKIITDGRLQVLQDEPRPATT